MDTSLYNNIGLVCNVSSSKGIVTFFGEVFIILDNALITTLNSWGLWLLGWATVHLFIDIGLLDQSSLCLWCLIVASSSAKLCKFVWTSATLVSIFIPSWWWCSSLSFLSSNFTFSCFSDFSVFEHLVNGAEDYDSYHEDDHRNDISLPVSVVSV